MCLPFFHRFEYKLLEKINVVWLERNEIPMYKKWVYVGTCSKCGTIKRKVIKS